MKLLVLPDLQVKPGVPLVHLNWLGRYIAEKRPDAIVQIGDALDLPSLSSYDRGKRSAEGRRLEGDLEAGKLAFDLLTQPYRGLVGYQPLQIFTEGNHEARLYRLLDDQPYLHGQLHYAIQDIVEARGFEFNPFLEVREVSGVLCSHFFARSAQGTVVQTKNGAPSAREMVRREGQSAIAGHRQGIDLAVVQTQSKRMYGVIAGSCYLHLENYLGPQGSNHWNGCVMLHELNASGESNPMLISLEYLCKRYTGRDLPELLHNGTDLEVLRAPTYD